MIFEFAAGANAKDYVALAKKEHLKPLEVRSWPAACGGGQLPAWLLLPLLLLLLLLLLLEYLNRSASSVRLQLELRKLEDRIEGIFRELQYQREREEEHRNTNESTNSRVQWFSLLTILIVLGTAGAQVSYLFNFFKRKKMM